MLALAIKQNKMVEFIYHGAVTKVSPYYLVISMGKYYLLCNKDGKCQMSHYRVDKMVEMRLTEDEHRYPITKLNNVDGRHFRLETYMKQHPRMYTDMPVEVALYVKERQMQAVRMEFYIEYERRIYGESYDYKVIIKSPKLAIATWIINTTNLVEVADDYGCGLIDMLKEKANAVMKVYGENEIQLPVYDV